MNAFWRAGYSATSLDDLTAATGMNRPSLYGAFGDKRALYLHTLDRYYELAKQAFIEALALPTLKQSLERVYEISLALYLPADDAQRGCFLISTAAVESVKDEEIRAKLRDSLRAFDRGLESRIRRAQTEGEIDADADPAALCLIASSIQHSLAVRSRAGESRTTLNAMISAGISVICRTASTRRTNSRALQKKR